VVSCGHLKLSGKAGLEDPILFHVDAPVPRETPLSSATERNTELFVCHSFIKQPVFLETSLTKSAAPQLVRNQKISVAGSCPEGKEELAFLIRRKSFLKIAFQYRPKATDKPNHIKSLTSGFCLQGAQHTDFGLKISILLFFSSEGDRVKGVLRKYLI